MDTQEKPRRLGDCPCNGKASWSWHYRRRRLVCQAAADNGMINKESAIWNAGTSIYVPEDEEP